MKTISMSKMLDQYYTTPDVAIYCMSHLKKTVNKIGLNLKDYWFIEPSAGCGCFYQTLPEKRRIGVDISPNYTVIINKSITEEIICVDYLEWMPPENNKYIVIGNPPFGKRGKLAVNFFNHSNFADVIAFIVPVSFRKYAIHKLLDFKYKFISKETLGRDSFFTPDLKEYSVNSEFQVWTKVDTDMKDYREKIPPAITHEDFTIRQYNNTKMALKEFNKSFDFAVPCQGYQDYTRREINADKCEKNKQWMLFTAKTKSALNRLKSIDYNELAMTCSTSTPGFRKNDVVKHYLHMFNNRNMNNA